MDFAEAYDQLNGRFIELAESEGVPIRPTLGRRNTYLNEAPYFEANQDRWISIMHELGALDPQWNGQHNPAHMQVFADLDSYDLSLLWRLRSAWMNPGVDPEQAEEEVLQMAADNALSPGRP